MKVDYVHKQLMLNEHIEIYHDYMETGVIILSGKYVVKFEDENTEVTGERSSVFEADGHVIYIPREYTGKITSQSDTLDMVIISTHAERKLKPFVKKNGFHKEQRGEKEYKRTVVDLIAEEDETDSLFIGETYHTDGVWSGYPPHKHDQDIIGKESKNEEMYFVKVKPTTGFGVFISYDDKNEKKSTIVKDDDFIYVNQGYHAILSTPGYEFYYLWAASSRNKKFILSLDSDFAWIKG